MSNSKPIILIAPASFKGSLSASEAAVVMRDFLAERFTPSQADLRLCPIADGGDDTLSVLQAANPEFQSHTVAVTGPLPGMKVQAQYLVNPAQKTVLIEAAQAHGLKLMPADAPLDALRATSYGVGELMRHVLTQHQPETLVVTLGGSASTDGGMGALQALGARFVDAAGQSLQAPLGGGSLSQVQHIEWPAGGLNFSWKRLMIVTDVVNPLLGVDGAAAVFGPQKGATPAQCQQLDEQLQHVSQLMAVSLEHEPVAQSLTTLPGVGAAGGLGYGLRCLPRSGIVSGSQWVAEQLKLPQLVAESQFILTGEGCLDATSLGGKATGHLLAMAGDRPVLFFCGQVRDGLTGWGNVSVYPMVSPNQSADLMGVARQLNASPNVEREALQAAMTNPKAALRRQLEAAWPRLESLLASV